MKNRYLHSSCRSNKSLALTFSVVMSLVLQASYPVFAGNNSPDWDNDGLSDEVEALIGSEIYLSDTDGDGIPDKVEVGDITEPRDSDNDGLLDVLDTDDDNDGIPSAIEGVTDNDKDGKPAYLDTDSDADGLADRFEAQLTGKDTDGDGVDNLFDVDATKGQDSNGDGIDDKVTLVDSNKNGVPDFLDNKSTLPHISALAKKSAAAKKSATANKNAEARKDTATNKTTTTYKKNHITKENNPLLVSAAKLPTQVMKSVSVPQSKSKHKPKHSYIDKEQTSGKGETPYGGSGYFYCANTGKIVNNIPGFKMTPPEKVTLLRDASEGDYKWSAEEPGTYALQFQIPQGMSIVRGLAKGRRIVKSGDTNPLVLGAGKHSSKKGYLVKASETNSSWYTSFEIKDNAPLVANNNIPLSGGICAK